MKRITIPPSAFPSASSHRLRSFVRWLYAFVLGLTCVAAASAQSTIFVTRHADREGFEPDPPLTARGECRAEALSLLLSDAKIKHIYVSDTLRARQTASPTSRLSGVLPVIVPQPDFDGLIAKVRETLRPGESTLVVGHRESVGRIVKALCGETIEPLGSGEYTRLFVITVFPDGKTSLFTLRQGVQCDKDPAFQTPPAK